MSMSFQMRTTNWHSRQNATVQYNYKVSSTSQSREQTSFPVAMFFNFQSNWNDQLARSPKCPQQLQQSKLAKRGMKFIEEKRFIYSSNSGV